MHFGKPTAEQKDSYTRVLQGHIAISSARWPAGLSGYQMDPFARKALWEVGKDYGHGSGHGVGAFLGVHEGPQGFGSSSGSKVFDSYPFVPGMVLTIEPGYYVEGNYGCRIESLIMVKEWKHEKGEEQFLEFERATQVPIATNLIDFSLLSRKEKDWLKAHNGSVKTALLPLLKEKGDRRAIEWLKKQ